MYSSGLKISPSLIRGKIAGYAITFQTRLEIAFRPWMLCWSLEANPRNT
jgi:hypothetical protein